MPVDVDVPPIDHHCHGLVPRNVTRREFEKMISESFVDAPAGTSHFDAPFGLATRAHCAPPLHLEPFADPGAYIERRAALGAPEVNKRFVKAANHGLLLIDTGFRADDILTPDGVSGLTGVPSRKIVRIEAAAKRVGRSGVGAGQYPQAFADALAEAAKDAVGVKTIVACRGGFAFDPRRTLRCVGISDTHLLVALSHRSSPLKKCSTSLVKLENPGQPLCRLPWPPAFERVKNPKGDL
jgi:hypothetical protein